MSARRAAKLVRRAKRKQASKLHGRVRAAGFELANAILFNEAAKLYAAEHPDEEGSQAILYPDGEPAV